MTELERLRLAVRIRLQEGDKLYWGDDPRWVRVCNDQMGTCNDYWIYQGCILNPVTGHTEPLPDIEMDMRRHEHGGTDGTGTGR